jgi:toxin CptA
MAGMQRYYTLRPSRLLALSFFLLCAASFAALWSLSFPLMGLFVLTVLTLWWGGYHLLLDASMRLQHSCVAFRLDEGGEIVLVLRNGRHLPCRVARDSLVTPWLVVLNVELSEQRASRSLVIMPDAMAAESFRRLRVALRWGDKDCQAAL